MKKSVFLFPILTSVIVLFSGCTKSQSHKDELKKQLAEINQKTQNDIDQILKDALKITNGGQPGTITLSGVLVIDEEKLDSRLTLSQEAGRDRSGSSTAITKNLLILSSLKAEQLEKIKTDLKIQATGSKTFINIGCDLAESEIAGLTEVSAAAELEKDVAILSATRVFMCGEKELKNLVFSVFSNEIMLKDASIKVRKDFGNLSLKTGTLVLVGNNKIASAGESGSGYIAPAAAISITVANEIYGDGQIALESKGGDNVGGN